MLFVNIPGRVEFVNVVCVFVKEGYCQRKEICHCSKKRDEMLRSPPPPGLDAVLYSMLVG
jgi:hypothetical protein